MWLSRPESRTQVLFVGWLVCVASTALAGPQPEESIAHEVLPGGVVRWPGDDLLLCGFGQRSWTPLDDACWYPVDLLRAKGRLELWREEATGRRTRTVRVAAYPYPEQRITLEDDSKVNLSAADVVRARRESARIAAIWPVESERRFVLPLATPLAEMPMGGRFGSRRVFNDQPRSPHTGADYSVETGTAVLAVAAGEVRLAEEHFFAGRSVFIDHGDGLVSMYFHLSQVGVAAGDQVERGQRIGRVGQSGRATGPHLHFGLRWHGARIDPKQLLGSVDRLPSLLEAGAQSSSEPVGESLPGVPGFGETVFGLEEPLS